MCLKVYNSLGTKFRMKNLKFNFFLRYLVIIDDEKDEVYFEILHEEEDGTFTAFHRSYDDQTDLIFSEFGVVH